MVYFFILTACIIGPAAFYLYLYRTERKRRASIAGMPKHAKIPPPPAAPGRLFDEQDVAKIAKKNCKQCFGRGFVPMSTDRAPGKPLRDTTGAFLRDKNGAIKADRFFVPVYCNCILKRMPPNVIAWQGRYYLIEGAKTTPEALARAERKLAGWRGILARTVAFFLKHGGRGV